MATITIPSFDFSAFYYPQLLEELLVFKRLVAPELTNESPQEPAIQFLRAFALVGHLNNVLLDMVANESTLPTARLASSVRNMLQLIGYQMYPATPSQVDILAKLVQQLSSSTQILPTYSQYYTVGTPAINFEVLDAVTISRTDQFSYVLTEDNSLATFTDVTADANDDTPGSTFSPWSTPAGNDAIYFGHEDILWNKIAATVITAAADIVGIWEYYDGNTAEAKPDEIIDNEDGTLKFRLTTLLGVEDRTGTEVKVSLDETGASETALVVYEGGVNYIYTTGLLAQVSIETDETKYTVGREWHDLDIISDEILDFSVTGIKEIEFTLPQSTISNWRSTEVNSKDNYWVRYRIISIGGSPTSPEIEYVSFSDADQYVMLFATQGFRVVEASVASGDGTPNQRVIGSQENYIYGTGKAFIDGVEWTAVDSFISSTSTDRHFRVTVEDNDVPVFIFGDGVSGAIPTAGIGNIDIEYRTGADLDGNVGANTITKSKKTLTYIDSITNPRAASGWKIAEGADETSLEQAKINGPASLRTGEVALGPDGVETLTRDYVSESGAQPFARSKAVEEAYGLKTVGNIVVTVDGTAPSTAQLEELDTYFNGDKTVYPPKAKHFIANQEVVNVPFAPKVIDIVANVWSDTTLTEEQIKNNLTAIVQPLAKKADGVTWEWDFGEDVPVSRLSHIIFDTDPGITKVEITNLLSDVGLVFNELPTIGTVTINFM